MLLLTVIFVTGCNLENETSTIKGEYIQVKGCDGLVDEILIKTTCEEYDEYAGKIIEVTGKVTESECTSPQCFAGQEIKDIEVT